MKLTVKQAAARMEVSPSLVYSLLKQGRLVAIRIGCRGKGRWKIEEEVLAAFVASCKAEVAPVASPPLGHIR